MTITASQTKTSPTKTNPINLNTMTRVAAAVAFSIVGLGLVASTAQAENPPFDPGTTLGVIPGPVEPPPPPPPSPGLGGPDDLGICQIQNEGQDPCDEGPVGPNVNPEIPAGPDDLGICQIQNEGQDPCDDGDGDGDNGGDGDGDEPEVGPGDGDGEPEVGPGDENPDPEAPDLDQPVPADPNFTG